MPLIRRVAIVAVLGTAAASLSVTAARPAGAVAVDESYPVPPSGVFSLSGRGFGHGHGMSQWGAYGAAKVGGLDAPAILDFYYPGTSLVTDVARTVRVRLHALTGGAVVVRPIAGRTLTAWSTAANVPSCRLPASLDGGKTTVRWWRAAAVTSNGQAAVRLQSTVDGSTWQAGAVPGCDAAWGAAMAASVTFTDGGSLDVVRPGGAVTRYRGRMRAAFTGSGIYPVDMVPLEGYLRSVVPSEMPASWSAAALQAQAVAARTYATYGIAHPKTPYYDVYDDTRDQVYAGMPAEDPRSDSAVAATAREVLHDAGGGPAFTQFGAADGGWTADGGQPYLTAHQDWYDGAIPNSAHAWTASLAASTVDDVFSARIGDLREIDVTGRDGHGVWGGRVTALTLVGSRGSVSMSGTAFRGYFGLRSEWFAIALPPNPPTYVTARRAGSTVSVGWQPPASSSGSAVTGYRVTLAPTGTTQTLPASARSTTLGGLADGTDYTVSVAATSAAGVGRSVTVTTKVTRLGSAGGVRGAVAVSRATFPAGGAGAVVLASTRSYAQSLAAGPFAASRRAPVLLTASSGLSAAARTEIERVLPAGRTVYLLGGRWAIGDGVRATLAGDGYRVVRIAGATAAATAVKLANWVGRRRAVFEVTAHGWRQALVAAPAAVARRGVVLLTNGTTQAPETARWLAAHPSLPRYAIGAAAADADPSATEVVGRNAYALSALVAATFFPSAPAAVVVGTGRYYAALAADGRTGRLGVPLLLSPSRRLTYAVGRWLSSARSRLAWVELDGGGLRYYDVESRVQAALLG